MGAVTPRPVGAPSPRHTVVSSYRRPSGDGTEIRLATASSPASGDKSSAQIVVCTYFDRD